MNRVILMRPVIQSASRITIFVTDADEVTLRGLIQKEDNTFGPKGSGGYEIKEEALGVFIFKQRDVELARSFIVKVKDNKIYAGVSADFISGLLIKSEILFETRQIRRPPKIPPLKY